MLKVRLAHIATLATLSTICLPALGAPPCFREAPGITGYLGQAPQWWISGAQVVGSSTNRWIDDPRWLGSSSFGEVQDGVRFRGLMDTEPGNKQHLVLMWHVRNDANGVTGDDRIFLGFYDKKMKRGAVIRIDATAAYPGEGQGPGALAYFFYENAAWTARAVPSWLSSETKVDVFTASPANEWAVRLRIPITESTSSDTEAPLTPGGEYKFFYQLQSNSAIASTPYNLPDGLPFIDGTSCGIGACLPPLNKWATFIDKSDCIGDISLVKNDIYIETPGNTRIQFPPHSNLIKARPTNNTTDTQNGDSIRARFRLSNWGSVVGQSPTWQDLTCPAIDREKYVLGASVPVVASDKFDVSCPWSVPAADVPSYSPNCTGPSCRSPNQSLMVDLAIAPGAPGAPKTPDYTFAPQSAIRNLQFTGASKVVSDALIDIRDVQAGDPPRDVYLYVETKNMPKRFKKDSPSPGRLINPALAKKLKEAQISPLQGRTIGAKQAAQIQKAMANSMLTQEEVEIFMPSYTIHAWHDSGERLNGKPILTPQPSLTYVIHHDGKLEGWEHALTAPNSTLKELIPGLPNFYKLRVPKGGQTKVVTTIEALEDLPGGSHGECVDCAKPDHEHEHKPPTIPPHSHCACNMPGLANQGGLAFLLGALLLALAQLRRRRSAD